MRWLQRTAEGILWASSALAVFLAFAWPFIVSSDADSPTYRALALVALWGLLGAIVVLIARKAWRFGR
jgi:hypothetical protein